MTPGEDEYFLVLSPSGEILLTQEAIDPIKEGEKRKSGVYRSLLVLGLLFLLGLTGAPSRRGRKHHGYLARRFSLGRKSINGLPVLLNDLNPFLGIAWNQNCGETSISQDLKLLG